MIPYLRIENVRNVFVSDAVIAHRRKTHMRFLDPLAAFNTVITDIWPTLFLR